MLLKEAIEQVLTTTTLKPNYHIYDRLYSALYEIREDLYEMFDRRIEINYSEKYIKQMRQELYKIIEDHALVETDADIQESKRIVDYLIKGQEAFYRDIILDQQANFTKQDLHKETEEDNFFT